MACVYHVSGLVFTLCPVGTRTAGPTLSVRRRLYFCGRRDLVCSRIWAAMEHLSPNRRAWRRFVRNRPALVSAVFLAAMVLVILVWPLLARYSPIAVSDLQTIPPSAQHWFGTDVHGRDLLTRIFYGARISLLVGAVGAAVSLVIGVMWGALAGYLGGRWDSFLMR